MTTSNRVLQRCEPHGLMYDPSIHDGCTLCRGSAHSVRGGGGESLKTLAMVVLMALWVGGVLSAGYAGYQRMAGRARSASAASRAPAPMPAEPEATALDLGGEDPLPAELPMLGRTGVDADGYPRDAVNERGLRALLRAGEFPALTRHVEQLQTDFEAEPRKEDWVTQAFDAFEDADPRVGERIDQWVLASPGSFAPVLARAQHRIAEAWYFRGHAFSADTANDRLVKYKAILADAEPDVLRALALRPRLVVAREIELWLVTWLGRAGESRKQLDAALAVCPDCFRIRSKYLSSIVPRWGGSFEDMQGFAVESQALAARNPRMKVLLGYVDDEHCNVYREEAKLSAALDACDHALTIAHYHRFHASRMKVLRQLDRYPEALAEIAQALDQEPQNVRYLAARAQVLIHQGQLQEGMDDLRGALRLETVTASMSTAVDDAVKALVYAGYERYEAGDDRGAIKALDLALSLSPGNEDARRRKALAERRLAGSSEVSRLEGATRADPTDFGAFKQLDDELVKTREFARIVEHWDRYIEAKPDDGRGYLERGGARFHAGDAAGAIADLDHACTAGLQEGCAGVRFVRAKTGQ